MAFDGLRVRASSVSTLVRGFSEMRAGRGRQRQGAARGPQAARRWDAVVNRHLPDVRGTTVASPKPSMTLEDALRAFYAVHAPAKAKDAPQIAAVFRRDFGAMDTAVPQVRRALQLINDAASSDDDSSDDEAESSWRRRGASAALASGLRRPPARPVLLVADPSPVFDVPRHPAPVLCQSLASGTPRQPRAPRPGSSPFGPPRAF